MNIQVVENFDLRYDSFISGFDDGRICHLPAWSQAVTKDTGLKSFYLAAIDDESLLGVFPLVYVNSKLFGRFLVSQAFSDYGGMLAVNEKVRESLFYKALETAKETRCKMIEFRNITALPYDLHLWEDKITMVLPLDPDPEKIWKSFNPKVRNQVRKAQKSNITASNGRLELLDDFYKIYTKRMHELGTPAYPKKILKNLLAAFPERGRIFVVKLKGLTLGAGLTFYFNGFVEMPLASTNTDYNSICPNNLLYWSVIEYYCLKGAGYFDFGRCTVEGPTYRFKKQWGADPVQLNYQYWTVEGQELNILSPANPRYKRRIELWKKMPLWFTRIVGPMISKNLP
ncbi:MAG: FemAB family XrtA/PEP-CTERM system-associated protein [Planctomycetota bacterium]